MLDRGLLGGVTVKEPQASDARRYHVAVVGPPPGSAGGMGTLMKHLAQTESNCTTIQFLDSGVGSSPREQQSKAIRLRIFVTSLLRLARHRREIDLVHINLATHGSTFRKVIFGFFCELVGLPYVVHLHGGNIVAYTRRLPAPLRLVQQRFVDHARAVIALGENWRPALADLWALDDDRIHVVYNAVPEPPESTKESPSEELVFVGRFEESKGANDLLDALLLVPDSAKVRLTVIGSLRDESIRQRIAQVEQRTAHRIRVTGWLDQDDVRSEAQGKGIFVLPSHFEGLPLALLDAMAGGLVPVVTPVGTVPEVVTDGENGFLVPVRAPQQLARVLTPLLADESLRHALGRNARATWGNRFDLSVFRASLDSIWVRTVKEKVPGGRTHPGRTTSVIPSPTARPHLADE